MRSVKEILASPPISPYTGSTATYELMAKQIEERWGPAEVKRYDPYSNALTFSQWVKEGFMVKKGEKSLRSITIIEKKDTQGNVVKKFKRTVCLFYYLQVEKAKKV